MDDLSFLAEIRILDLSDDATVYAASFLAELGAQVVRYEDMNSVRRADPVYRDLTNSGKTILLRDFTAAATWEEISEQLGNVDIVIGPMEATGPTADFLDRLAQRPEHVVFVDSCFHFGYGRSHPISDITLTAGGGLLVLNGRSQDPPNYPAGELAYKQVSLVAAYCALIGYLELQKTGRGTHLLLSGLEAVAYTTCQTSNGNIYHWHRGVPNRHSQLAANTTVRTGDAEWCSFTIHPPAWPKFRDWARRVLGPHLLEGSEWLDPLHVERNREVVSSIVGELAGRLTRSELVDTGQSLGLLVLPVNSAADVAADTHLHLRDFFTELHSAGGRVTKMPGSAFRSSVGRGARRLPVEVEGSAPVTSSHRRPAVEPNGSQYKPLEGIRVVDFCWAMAGPLATRMLADLGADVIKIESENRLDPIRHVGPQPTTTVSLDTNGVFQDGNSGKRAISVNLETDRGKEIVRELFRSADIVTSNFTPDRLEKWGLGYDTAKECRPDVIMANLAVMGTYGPHKGWRSYGSGIVAMSGISSHTGFDGAPPECVGTMHTDFTVPYFATMFILAALENRAHTGDGAYLELSQYESAVRLMDYEVAAAMNDRPIRQRLNNSSLWEPLNGVFPTVRDDEWVAIACRDQTEVRRLSDLVRPGAGGHVAGTEELAAWSRSMEADEIERRLVDVGIAAAKVRNLEDQMTDPGFSPFWETVDLGGSVSAKVMNPPFRWDGSRLVAQRGPRWMEHNFEVLVEELGMDVEEFAQLLEEKVLW